MSEQQTICQVLTCHRPSDGWIVCGTCGEVLEQMLAEMPWMLDELDTVIAMQTKYAERSAASAAETSLLFDLKASETLGALVNELDTSARLIAEANGWKLSYAREDRMTNRAAKQCSAWLLRRISAIRLHVAGGEIVDGIARWLAAAQWVIDRPLPRQFYGDCVDMEGGPDSCPGRVYGRDGKLMARCDTCSTEWVADEVRQHLIHQLEDRRCTAAEIAQLSTYLGLTANRTQVRKRINQWSSRGQIARNEGQGGEATFRFGEVYSKLLQDETHRLAPRVVLPRSAVSP